MKRFIRLKEVLHRVPFSRATIYKKIAKAEFPHPYSLGDRAVAWLESDIEGWIAARLEAGRPTAEAV